MSDPRHSFLLSYVDMLFAMLAAIFSIFILDFLLINVKKDTSKVDPRAQIQLVMTWDDHSANDIDLWCMTPDEDAIGYTHRENGYVFLDRDDLGQYNDTTIVDGKKQILYINQEVMSIRQRKPGHYIVNAEFFAIHEDEVTHIEYKGPEKITVRLIELEPSYKIVYAGEVTLNKPYDEATAFQFDIDNDGKIQNITTDQHPFVMKSRASYEMNEFGDGPFGNFRERDYP